MGETMIILYKISLNNSTFYLRTSIVIFTRNIYNNSLMSCNSAANLLMRVMCLILDYVDYVL